MHGRGQRGQSNPVVKDRNPLAHQAPGLWPDNLHPDWSFLFIQDHFDLSDFFPFRQACGIFTIFPLTAFTPSW